MNLILLFILIIQLQGQDKTKSSLYIEKNNILSNNILIEKKNQPNSTTNTTKSIGNFMNILLFFALLLFAPGQQEISITVNSGKLYLLSKDSMSWEKTSSNFTVNKSDLLLSKENTIFTVQTAKEVFKFNGSYYFSVADLMIRSKQALIRALLKNQLKSIRLKKIISKNKRFGLTYGSRHSDTPKIPFYKERSLFVEKMINDKKPFTALSAQKKLMDDHKALYENTNSLNTLIQLYETIGFTGHILETVEKLETKNKQELNQFINIIRSKYLKNQDR